MADTKQTTQEAVVVGRLVYWCVWEAARSTDQTVPSAHSGAAPDRGSEAGESFSFGGSPAIYSNHIYS